MSATIIPRKPVATPAAPHLTEGNHVNSSRSSTIRLVITDDGQDTPSNPQTKEIAIGPESRDTPSPTQLDEGKSYGASHHQDESPSLQQKEINIQAGNGDSESSLEAGGVESRKKKRYGLSTLGCLGGIKSSKFVSTLSHHFNNLLPPQKRYLKDRVNRRTLLIMIGVALVSLLALIIGLAVGLPSRSHHHSPKKPDGAQEVTGDLTYFMVGLGACGITNHENDAIVAISHERFDEMGTDSNPNHDQLCGKKIRAHRIDSRTGKDVSMDFTITDRCVGCLYDDIDISPVYFDKMADHAAGRVKVQWYFL
ncbi:riboflavin aldehyde-forming enzyme [Pyrenophora seminiperda CCB06]|uniref:Riboflavin aldehyde-forming enzyme n=1 Tax=Pyrenophora seminiperda CCB06 TaxID=1302712 RepID=A0A3M7MGC7_9PLEO|nr:riboflavin aldehyde-forming enzyme [Pyrenophora seminiperda CCB06]